MAAAKNMRLVLEPTSVGFKYSTYFNRFHLEPIDSFLLLTVGLLRNERELIYELSLLLSSVELQLNRASNMEYIEKLKGQDLSSIKHLPWTPTRPFAEPPMLVNYFGFNRSGELGEMTFFNYSLRHAWEESKANHGKDIHIKGQSVAILRSTVPVQIDVILGIYSILPTA